MAELNGKRIRLSRLTEAGKMVCVPMDHGVTSGPIRGLVKVHEAIRKAEEGGATAVVVHKGVLKTMPFTPRLGLIVHASASTSVGPSPNWKVKVASVLEALKLGADGVSVHVNLGAEREPEMLMKLAAIAEECDALGVPLLAMMYPRGKSIRDPHSPELVAHAARLGAELGADVVKTAYTGSPESFRRVVEGCPVPVVIAGGPKAESELQVFKMVEEAMEAGAAGVALGRNVFQHSRPELMLKCIRMIVLGGASAEEAMEVLRSELGEQGDS